MKEFGERLRELREDKGLSRVQLAQKTGFTEASISRWERAVTIPDIQTLKVFAQFFGCTADFLIGIAES